MPSLPNIDQSLSRIRGWRSASGWTVSRLANEAGLTESTLRFLDSDNWNPTAETLRKLEAVIPPGWQPGHAVPPIEAKPEGEAA